MANKDCPKCGGAGRVKDKNGTVHVCFNCLQSGDLDQHSKEVKDSGIRT